MICNDKIVIKSIPESIFFWHFQVKNQAMKKTMKSKIKQVFLAHKKNIRMKKINIRIRTLKKMKKKGMKGAILQSILHVFLRMIFFIGDNFFLHFFG